MKKFNLLKINKPTLKELLNKHYNKVIYLTRNELSNPLKNTFITIHYFNHYFLSKVKIKKADIIIFVDGDKCNILKIRNARTGVYNTQTLFNSLDR